MSCIFTNTDKKFCMWLFMIPVYLYGNMLGPSNNNLKSSMGQRLQILKSRGEQEKEREYKIKYSNIHND